MLSYLKFDKESDYNIMRSIVQQNCLQTGHLYPQLHIGNLDFERYAWDDPISNIGILEPIACVEEHRRKGIMKSVLLCGMNLLKDRGTNYIYVSTGGKNIDSQALYKSVGFIEYDINCEWQKTL